MALPKTELLAPAGQPDAGYAALHYGADAVYLGLDRFSARAEAVNFTPDELAEFAAYAHSLSPRRHVYLTLNTLVKQAELPGAAETLLIAAECGVDAVIVQDLGVVRLIRERFPTLRLHASTQMAIHNLEGALAAKALGCDRVTMARELTLDELRRIASESGLEIEAFIHGTLCYSYSGICLFSSMITGRSGNRGRCVYTCREAADTPAGRAHPFSLKDMALGSRVRDLARAGVASLKIEGRKKSPLYVAATVDYYRRLLDGTLNPADAHAVEARLRTIFARPWTDLFIDGKHNPDAADPDVVGHRGSRIGIVERVVRTPAGPGILFTPDMPVERHDGLQVDIPGLAKPFGFPVDRLYTVRGKRYESAFAAPAGQAMAATLPEDAPPLERGLPLYLSSSQAVKRSYPFDRPKPGTFGIRHPLAVAVRVERAPDGGEASEKGLAVCDAAMDAPGFLCGIPLPGESRNLCRQTTEEVAVFPARDAAGAEQAAHAAFLRMGGNSFHLADWRFDNPACLFARPGDWNRVRRKMVDVMQDGLDGLRRMALEELRSFCAPPDPANTRPAAVPAWSVCADIPAHLAAFSPEDFAAMEEVAVGIGGSDCEREMERLAQRAGREKIRLVLPLILREDSSGALREKVLGLHHSGWRRWLVPNLYGWNLLAGLDGADMAADWPLYSLNTFSIGQLRDMGFSSFTLSPEDDAANMREVLRAFGESAVAVAYSDLPLFVSAACAHAHIGLCRSGKGSAPAACPNAGQGLPIRLERSGEAVVWPTACGSVVTGTPFSLAGQTEALRLMGAARFRVDLRWKPRRPEEAAAIWRTVRSGGGKERIAAGNFGRGLI